MNRTILFFESAKSWLINGIEHQTILSNGGLRFPEHSEAHRRDYNAENSNFKLRITRNQLSY